MSWWYYWADLERENNRLVSEIRDLSRQVSTLGNNVWDLDRQKTRLSNENRELSSQVSTLRDKVWGLEQEKTRMFNENRELRSQNTKLSDELVKHREDTRKAGLLFMDAADTYQQSAKKQISAKAAELEDTRKASMLLMNAADAYQGEAKKQTKAKEEEMEETRKAVLVLMSAADMYQQEAKKQIKEKDEELKILGSQKAEVDAMVASLESGLNAALSKNQELQANYDSLKGENNKLRSEVEKLVMENAAAKEFYVEKMELEDLKMNAEEIQASKDLMEGENHMLQSEVLTEDPKHSLFDGEV